MSNYALGIDVGATKVAIATATNEFKREIKSFNLKGILPANLIEDK